MPERGADPTNIEVEWQLDALDLRPVERWLADFPRIVPGQTKDSAVVVTIVGQPVTRTVDVYLDTEDWRIRRSGFVLRVRHRADEGEITLKDTNPAVAGLRRRIELTEPLPAGGIDALGAEGPVGGRLRALTGDAPLGQLVEVRTRRRPYQLCAADELLAELDLDDTIIVVGDDEYPVRMRRVEIEADPRWVDLLTPLVDQLRRDCGLQPAILSKFEVGLLAAGLRVPEPSDLGPTTLGPDPSVGELAYAVLRRNVGAMLAHEAGTRLGEDIEHLHDMRVATRRLRAALALFAGVLPGEADRLADELGWLADELGAVRDLDVQRERMEDWGEIPGHKVGALTDLARLLDGERDRARGNLLAALDSERYDALVADISAMLRAGVGTGSSRRFTAARAPATAVVPGLILARHHSAARAARRARRSGDPADFHRLRIRCKRLRYALEFVAEIYEGQTKPVIRRIVGLQDCLGLLQDSQVAAGRLQALAMTENSGLSPAAVFAMGAVAERYRRDAERLTAMVPDHLRALQGPAWRKLKKVMERRRVQAGPPDTSSPAKATPSGPTRPDEAAPERIHGSAVPPGSSSPRSRITPASPFPDRVADDDSDWEDEYTSPLHSVPGVSNDAERSEMAEEPDERPGPEPPPPSEPYGGRRRKEPVFLPAPPAAARPATARPGTVRPVRRSEPPDDDRTRSFHDRP